MSDADRVRRFVVEHQAVRGQFARLGASWLALREHLDYPAPVQALLGEAASAAVLLASTLKFEGLLTLQMQGDGAVRLLVAQCTHDFKVRGVARFDAARVTPEFATLAGRGQISVTIETARGGPGARYQGVVPIDGGSLAASLEHYFAQSEQLPTVVRLAASEAAAGGVLIQRVPGEGGAPGADGSSSSAARDAEADRSFDAARSALEALPTQELLLRPAEDLTRRCLPGMDLRLFAGQQIAFQCRCSRERVAGMLRTLGSAEIHDVLAEQGAVTVTCEFCQRPYRFDAIDVEQLFQPGGGAETSQRLN